MFGDKLIYGIGKYYFDSKRRITLPKMTNGEIGETIYFRQDPKNNLTFQMFGYKILKKRLEEYNKLINNALSYQCKIELIKERDKYNYFIMGTCIVDTQKRILIPKSVYDRYNLSDYVIVRGVGEYVNVFSNEENMEKYTMSLD